MEELKYPLDKSKQDDVMARKHPEILCNLLIDPLQSDLPSFNVKFQLTILLMAISFAADGQRHATRDRYPINSSNHFVFYQRANDLVRLNNPDSSWEATRILQSLLYYDSSEYSMERYQPLLEKIESGNRHFYQATLEGQWKFEWSGSNWGTHETSKDVNRSILFTDKEAIFFSGDTVKRRTVYHLSNKFLQSRFAMVNFFGLVFADNKEEWTIRFHQGDGFVPYIGHTKTIAMLTNQMPNCVCGCPEEVYNKVVDMSIVNSK